MDKPASQQSSLLISPNSSHTVVRILSVVVRETIEEVLSYSVVTRTLARTPIVAVTKTAETVKF